MKEKLWFVYIIKCKDKSFYTGITDNLMTRMINHNRGVASKYTRTRRPCVLVYEEKEPTRSIALKRESVIKHLSHKEKEILIKSDKNGKSKD